LPIIEEKMEPNSILYTDTFKTYNALDVSDFHHMRVNHSELFVDKGNQINGIEILLESGQASSASASIRLSLAFSF